MFLSIYLFMLFVGFITLVIYYYIYFGQNQIENIYIMPSLQGRITSATSEKNVCQMRGSAKNFVRKLLVFIYALAHRKKAGPRAAIFLYVSGPWTVPIQHCNASCMCVCVFVEYIRKKTLNTES